MVVAIICASPAWPPQAILTEVIERMRASCVPSEMCSGLSPMSQFKSMLFICPQQCARASFPANFSKDIIMEGGSAGGENSPLHWEGGRGGFVGPAGLQRAEPGGKRAVRQAALAWRRPAEISRREKRF